MNIQGKYDQPLVSIIIITYNSVKYLLETLNSVKGQSYQHIELIITDDCSTDTTVSLCQSWLMENQERFVRTEIISVVANTGIPGNCNRGLKASKGIWVKFFAGDDTLEPDCINRFIEETKKKEGELIFHSRAKVYKDEFKGANLLPDYIDFSKHFFNSDEVTAEIQKQILLRFCPVFAPAVFVNRQLLLDVGLFDERFTSIEDRPMWLKLTSAGFKFNFVHEYLINYRIHSDSVQRKSDKKVFVTKHAIRSYDFMIKEVFPQLPVAERVINYMIYYTNRLIFVTPINNFSFLCKLINFFVLRTFDKMLGWVRPSYI